MYNKQLTQVFHDETVCLNDVITKIIIILGNKHENYVKTSCFEKHTGTTCHFLEATSFVYTVMI